MTVIINPANPRPVELLDSAGQVKFRSPDASVYVIADGTFTGKSSEVDRMNAQLFVPNSVQNLNVISGDSTLLVKSVGAVGVSNTTFPRFRAVVGQLTITDSMANIDGSYTHILPLSPSCFHRFVQGYVPVRTNSANMLQDTYFGSVWSLQLRNTSVILTAKFTRKAVTNGYYENRKAAWDKMKTTKYVSTYSTGVNYLYKVSGYSVKWAVLDFTNAPREFGYEDIWYYYGL
jgi:hypothetical protein